MIETYPLHWPLGYKRNSSRIDSRFSQSPDNAQKFLRTELNRLGATGLIVSTNVPVRKDGFLYTDMMTSKIDDPGVAIYFKYKGKDVSMCCDQYNHVWENIYALGKGIESLRGMERWGVSDFLNRAFAGFKELPEETSGGAWNIVLGVPVSATEDEIKYAYRLMVKKYHPDSGGDINKFNLIQKAYEQALQRK